MYEALEEFQKFANQRLKTGKLQVKVTFLPMRGDQIEAPLAGGMGDIIASAIVVTSDREKRVAFSTPIQTDVTLQFRCSLHHGGPWRKRGVRQSAALSCAREQANGS